MIINNSLIKINKLIRKKYNFGFANNYPFRSSTELVKKLMGDNPIICVEIGTWEGENALNTLQKLPHIKKFYLIDPWETYGEYKDSDIKIKGFNNALKKTKRRLIKYKDKIEFIRDYSNNAITKIPNGVDFIYIDGNHDYEYVKKDMELYWDKLKPGGIMAGHDIQSWPGVAKAFCEFVSKNKLDPIIDRMDWILLKK